MPGAWNPGRIAKRDPPVGPNIRLDTHCYAGYTVPMFYDSMLARRIVYGHDRTEVLRRMQCALQQFSVSGIGTTLPFLKFIMEHPRFASAKVSTHLVEELVSQMYPQAAAAD